MKSILNELRSDAVKSIILDTDAYNEIDDQFALAYAMLSKDKVRLLSVNAAPFLNSRSVSAEDGMEKSYAEIFNVMRLVDKDADIPVFKGSRAFLTERGKYEDSPAADNIINTVMSSEERVYVVAIGALTNVASAVIKCPEIAERCVLIWLGGHSLHYPDTREFNLYQDVISVQTVFDSGIPLVQVPCNGVASDLLTTVPEIEHYLGGKNELCDYLARIIRDYSKGRYCYSKVIWDVAALALLIKPETVDAVAIPTPFVGADMRYSFDPSRHHYLYVRRIRRDPLFSDLFKKLSTK